MRALRVFVPLAACFLPSVALAQQPNQPQPVISIIEHTSIPDIFDTTIGEGPGQRELFIKDPIAQVQTFPLPMPDPRKDARAQAPALQVAPK